MKHVNAFSHVLLVAAAAVFWWFEFIPVVEQVALKSAPGFDYSSEFLFSFKGFAAVAIFGTTSVGVLLFLIEMALRLANWIYMHPENSLPRGEE